MAVSIVRLGTPRKSGEGLRIGTVRRPPRGVAKSRYAAENWFDVWYPNLAPTPPTVNLGRQAANDRELATFFQKYRREMAMPENARTLDLLAALSWASDFAVGCYCEDESRCHRSVLRSLLLERGAVVR
jgi:uncharacterized protein YeaO (DUF488 family)